MSGNLFYTGIVFTFAVVIDSDDGDVAIVGIDDEDGDDDFLVVAFVVVATSSVV